jgi:hypothetical protein
MVGQCYRCKGFFCVRHVRPQEDIVVQDGIRFRRTVRLCQHCVKRRPIWLRK